MKISEIVVPIDLFKPGRDTFTVKDTVVVQEVIPSNDGRTAIVRSTYSDVFKIAR